MKYKLVTVITNHENSELVASAMFDVGAEGVDIVDRQDFIDLLNSDVVWDYADEKAFGESSEVKVSTVVPEDDTAFLPALGKGSRKWRSTASATGRYPHAS